jgi:hypothetical protein
VQRTVTADNLLFKARKEKRNGQPRHKTAHFLSLLTQADDLDCKELFSSCALSYNDILLLK